MADTAAHLVDRVLPEVPIRQWVLTLPYSLRYRCAYDAKLTTEVLRAFLRSLFAELRRRARRQWGLPAEQCGAVSFIQRFGSALNLNVHFHTLVLDGVYPYEPSRGHLAPFLPLPPPGPNEMARVLAGAARRIQRVIEARDADDAEALARDEPLLALLTAASLRTHIATGPHRGEPWRRLGDRVDPRESAEPDADPEASERVPRYGGMSRRPGAGPATSRAALPLRRKAPARERATRAASGRNACTAAQDPLARRNQPHRDGTQRTHRKAGPADPTAACASGPLPRAPGAKCEPAGSDRAGPTRANGSQQSEAMQSKRQPITQRWRASGCRLAFTGRRTPSAQ